jgi:hypothetical protein
VDQICTRREAGGTFAAKNAMIKVCLTLKFLLGQRF